MGNAISTESRYLWTMLRHRGGRWTVAALYHYWYPSFGELELQEMLQALRKGGFVGSTLNHRGETCYAVDGNCKALPGLPLAPQQAVTQ